MQSRFLWSVRLFEAYAKYIWPVHRKFVKSKISKRCLNCAASEKMLPLDSHSICSLCHKITKVTPRAEQDIEVMAQELKTLLGQTRGSRQYDALLLFSGGKDSTYMLRKILHDFPSIRILAITIHNGFMSPIAESNVKNLIDKFRVDHIFVHINKNFHIKLFQYGLTHLAFTKRGAYEVVDFSDGELLLDTARNYAAQFEIPLILCGYSRYQVQDGLKLNHFESPPEQERQDREHVSCFKLTDIYKNDEKKYWWHGSIWPKERIAKVLFPLYAWNLEENEIKSKVTEWGLLPKTNHSPAITNHRLIPLFGIIDVHQRGYSSFEPEFCRMIREGKASLKEWRSTFEFLEYTAKTGLFIKPLVKELLNELDLTPQEVGIVYD